MAFTSDLAFAGSSSSHAVQIKANGQIRHLALSGNDMERGKGDLSKLNIDDFGFEDDCIKMADIQNIYIVATSNAGWNIDSIATFVKDADDEIHVLTQDLDVFQWIDENGEVDHRYFLLTKA